MTRNRSTEHRQNLAAVLLSKFKKGEKAEGEKEDGMKTCWIN